MVESDVPDHVDHDHDAAPLSPTDNEDETDAFMGQLVDLCDEERGIIHAVIQMTDPDPERIVDGIMYSLKGLPSEITDKDIFCKRFGTDPESMQKMIPILESHSLLFQKTAFADKVTVQRLVDELGVGLQSVYDKYKNTKHPQQTEPESISRDHSDTLSEPLPDEDAATRWVNELELPDDERQVVRDSIGSGDTKCIVDGIMYSLKGYPLLITDKYAFLDQFGTNSEFIHLNAVQFSEHCLLFKDTVFSDKVVLERLVEELEVGLQSQYDDYLETLLTESYADTVGTANEVELQLECDHEAATNPVEDITTILKQKDESHLEQQKLIEQLQQQIASESESKQMEEETSSIPKSPKSSKSMDSKSEKGRKNKGDKAKKQKKSNHGKAAANAKNSDLTKWMEKNGVFDEQLHSVLISQHISTLQQLVCLKEDKFEKIIRVARTEMIAKLKHQKKVKSIDEMLVKFERAWRKKTHTKAKHSKK